jgi:hypothetical protein
MKPQQGEERAMRRLMGVVLLVLVTAPAYGHFIFLVPAKDGRAEAVFSDGPVPDDAKLLKKIEHTKFVTYTGGKAVALKAETAGAVLRTATAGVKPTWVYGTCEYGVLAKGKAPFKLTYHCKTVLNAATTTKLDTELPAGRAKALKLDIVPKFGAKPTATVLWDGKPLAGAQVVVTVPGYEGTEELETNKDGTVALKLPKAKGVYALRARHIAATKGKFKDKAYDEERSYSTLTFVVK